MKKEIGLFHPSKGYWQIELNNRFDYLMGTYPDGTVVVPIKPSEYHEFDGEKWVMGVAPTEAEIEAEKKEVIEQAIENRIDIAGFDKASALTLFNHENRIRALEGKQEITLAQFKSGFKGRV